MWFFLPLCLNYRFPLLKQTTSGFLQWFLWDFYGIHMDSYGFMTTWTSNHHGFHWFHHGFPSPSRARYSALSCWRSVKALAGRRVRWMMVTCWETSRALEHDLKSVLSPTKTSKKHQDWADGKPLENHHPNPKNWGDCSILPSLKNCFHH